MGGSEGQNENFFIFEKIDFSEFLAGTVNCGWYLLLIDHFPLYHSRSKGAEKGIPDQIAFI